jgi:hypothetical protein
MKAGPLLSSGNRSSINCRRDFFHPQAVGAPRAFATDAADGEIENRQLFELEDFATSEAIDTARQLEQELAAKR